MSDARSASGGSLSYGNARAEAKKTTVKDASSAALSQYLSKLDLPQGILPAVLKDFHALDSRVFMVENSGAMQARDAFLVGGEREGEAVTRWDELTEYVTFHAKMASRCGISTKFSFLHNPDERGFGQEGRLIPQEYKVGGARGEKDEMEAATHFMREAVLNRPSAPLVEYVHKFQRHLKKDAKHLSYLKQRKKFISLSLATQGVPTGKDGQSVDDAFKDLRKELFALNGLPVKLTVRLCTDDEETFRMYNKLDGILDYCDVLDDFAGESHEVYLYNPWLTYSLGLHRLREAGLAWGTVGELDEKPFSFDKIHQLCIEFFGVGKKDLPRPKDDWNGFLDGLQQINEREHRQYSMVKKRKASWIDIRKLESMKKGRKHSSRSARGGSELSLDGHVQHWAYTSSGDLRPMAELLVTVTDTFPPSNTRVEPHEYFSKWKPLAEDVFDECGVELHAYLLRKSLKKMKTFLHPERVPNVLTDKQSSLIKKLQGVFKKSEQASS